MEPRILFILKRRGDYNGDLHASPSMSTGLYNSAKFMKDMLVEAGVESNIEIAVDNNCIDRLVTKYRPTHVVIEALWVVPSKFFQLIPLHKDVKWIIRLHSETPFLAQEGMAFNWIGDYINIQNVYVAVNSPRMKRDVETIVSMFDQPGKVSHKEKVIYLPNYYPNDFKEKSFEYKKDEIDICCFGAVRPLKNHMVQAIGALKFADRMKKRLNFHVNADRMEGRGEPVMNNLQGLFSHLSANGHYLIGHTWAPRETFLDTCHEMDIGLQVSFSETFNIVAADLVTQGVPVVGSREIPWMSRFFTSDPTNSDSIATALERAYIFAKLNVKRNSHKLKKYTATTKQTWLNYFRKDVL